MSETSAASERAAVIEAQLTACRVQRDEAIARRDALAGENERLRAALDAAKAESARLREELRIVSRHAARLYDAVGEVADVVSAGLGDATREPAWVNALQRGREDGR